MIKKDLYSLYSSDPELVEKWHIKAGEGIDICVEDTWNIIKEHELYLFDFGYFSIDRYSDIVPTLGGFFIKPDYRTSQGKQQFIDELCKTMPKIFFSGLHNKNIRGIKFLEKLPGARLITTTDSYTYFVFRQGDIVCL